MEFIITILMLSYFGYLFFFAQKSFAENDMALDQDLNVINHRLAEKQQILNQVHKSRFAVEDEASQIYILYEMTKDITRSLHEEGAFQIFRNKLKEYVAFTDCRIYPPAVNPQDVKKSEDSFIFTLKSKRRKMGYLVVDGVQERDREKIVILGHQYALALRRVKLYEEIERIAITDSLTELHTRRYFLERFQEEMERVHRRNISMSVLMIDVDFFKKVNDEHGHLTGDQVLKEIGKIIRDNIREIDIAGRYGGEEFSIILPDTNVEGGSYVAERIRRATEEAVLKAYDTELKVTVSIGLATYPKDGKTAEELIDKADIALYQAKHTGRNRLCVFRNIK
jgi:diguanylate cyclase (GGDEF)-like protein